MMDVNRSPATIRPATVDDTEIITVAIYIESTGLSPALARLDVARLNYS